MDAEAGRISPPGSVASSVLPSIEEFLKNPAKSAEDWLFSLPKNKKFRLFAQDDIQEVFKTLMDYVKRLQDLDHDVLAPDLAESRSKDMNQLLEGVRGVGKTSVAEGVCRFIDAMRDRYGQDFHVVSFYYNCEKSSDLKRPRVLLTEQLNKHIDGFSEKQYENMEQVLSAAFDHDIRLFVVFDELQCKYVPRDHQDFRDHHSFVSDIYELGKECRYVATILTGSSVRARRFAFHQVDDLEPAARFAKDFPNLNNTVFSALTILPVRDRDTFTKIVNREGNLARDTVASLFYSSGGVGRHMSSTTLPPCSANSYFGNTDMPLQRDVVLRLLWANGLLQDNNGKPEVNEQRIKALKADPWSASTVHIKELISLLTAHTKTPLDVLHTMCDESLLHINGRQVSFLYPCHAVELAQSAAALMVSEDVTMTRFVHLLLSSGCQGMGSLGHYAQRDILQHAVSADLFPVDELQLSDHKLSFASGVVSLNGRQITQLDQIPSLTVFDCSVDKGSDGIWLEEGADDTLEMHLLQIKAGANGKTLRAGKKNPRLATSTTLATIKYRLIQAFIDIKSKLNAAHVDTSRLKLASLHLLTTKQVSDEQKTIFESNESDPSYADEAFLIEGSSTPRLTIWDDVDNLLPQQHAVFYKIP